MADLMTENLDLDEIAKADANGKAKTARYLG